MKNKLPAKKVFDPNWLKSAMKSKRTIQCTSSKKKNPKLRSNDKPEHLSLKLKSSLTCKLLPKFMLNSKNQPGGTDRSKSKNKLKEQSRRSQSISAKKNINMTCKSHKLIEHNTQSGLVSHILIPKSSRSGRGLSSSRRDRPASYSKDYLKPRIRPAHGSSCNFLKPNYSVNASSKRFLQPTSMLYSSNITNRKREFSKSLHEKVLSKLSNNHERLSSHGLHPADWGQFNLEVFKENWKKNKKAQVTHVAANRSNSRLDVMQTLSHRRNISSLSKRSRSDAEQKDNRSKRHSKSRYQTSTSRPVLTLMNQMKADISRLRQSLAVDRWKHPRQKASPPSTKKSSFIKNTRS